MATSAIAPKLLKGALVSIPDGSTTGVVVAFQYNPESVTRALVGQYIGGEPEDRVDPVRFEGAPVETITLTVFVDATDQLDAADPSTLSMGIYPQLSALEILLYPSSSTIEDETDKLASGVLEILPPIAPLTLFVWGNRRVVPVRVDQCSVTEVAHDTNLNPIRANVSLTLRVLSYSDMNADDPGYPIFMNYQIAKEQMAAGATSGSLAGVLSKDMAATLSNLQAL